VQKNFSQGISSILNEEGYEIVHAQIQEEKQPLFASSYNPKHYTEDNDVSPEVKKLMNNFLSLPLIPKEIIISYLERHSLAFFVHLPHLSNRIRRKAYKKLKFFHPL
jgi:hypothetical protein